MPRPTSHQKISTAPLPKKYVWFVAEETSQEDGTFRILCVILPLPFTVMHIKRDDSDYTLRKNPASFIKIVASWM